MTGEHEATPKAEQAIPEKPKRLRNAFLSLLMLCISATLTLGVVEVAARFMMGDGPYQVQLAQPDPTLYFVNKPDFKATLHIACYDPAVKEPMPVSISSQGLRDREYGPKAPGAFRVLMLGDSFTFGWGLPESESIPRKLEERLREDYPGRTIEVMNGGVTGYAPWQERGLFRRLAEELQPDLVILQTFVCNDVAHSLGQAGEPLETLRCYRPWRARQIRRLKMRAYALPRVDDWLLGHSWAYFAVCTALDSDMLLTRIWDKLGLGAQVEIPPLPPRIDRNFLYEIDLCRGYPELEKAWSRFADAVAGLRDDCLERGVGFAAYNIPYPFDPATTAAELAGYPEGTYCVDSSNTRAEEIFREHAVAHPRMLEAFRAYPQPEAIYFPANRHLNERGIALVVDTLSGTVFADSLELAGEPR